MKRVAYLLIAVVTAVLLAACGDTVENVSQINQMGMDVVASADDLPECSDENEGDQAYVKGETSARLCVDGKWLVTDRGSAKDTIVLAGDTIYLGGGDFSCKTEELADKSGLKIVCNGDSIGVVLNGAKGEDSKKGDDGDNGSGCTLTQTDTTLIVTCGDKTTTIDLRAEQGSAPGSDSEVSLDSLAGYSQKGPFLKGSTVYLYELDNGKTLKQTNGNFTSYITRDDGYYKFTSRNLVSPYALVIVEGNYRNEVTGDVSAQTIKLKALSDVRKHHKGANVNILTHLEYERVYYLVTKKGYDFDEAKRQAQKEIFEAFYINIDTDEDAESLDIFGKSEGDAALLAISVLLQGDRTEPELMVLLTEISNELADDGKWEDETGRADSIKAAIADWALEVDSDDRLYQIRENVRKWRLGDDATVPDFIPHIRNYVNTVTGLGECLGKFYFTSVKNPKSAYYTDPNVYDLYHEERVVCDTTGGARWRMVTALGVETWYWGSSSEPMGLVRKGRIDTSLTFVIDREGAYKRWRYGTKLERSLEKGCTQENKNEVVVGDGEVWYRCVPDTTMYQITDGDTVDTWNTAWRVLTPSEKDSIALDEMRDTAGKILTGPFTGKKVVWDADTLRLPTETELQLGKGCVTSMYGTRDTLQNTLMYTCYNTGWSKTGTFYDYRDGITYTAVQIGEQIWMAENLNYEYTVAGEVYGNSCYEDDKSNCAKYGRLYSWAAAMDSAGRFSEDGLGAGYGVAGAYGGAYPYTGKIRGVCPVDWRLPRKEDWEILVNYLDSLHHGDESYWVRATLLRSQTGWNFNRVGSDYYSFSVLPAGIFDVYVDENYDVTRSYYIGLGSSALFWSSTQEDEYWVSIMNVGEYAFVSRSYKIAQHSVRCIKDNPPPPEVEPDDPGDNPEDPEEYEDEP